MISLLVRNFVFDYHPFKIELISIKSVNFTTPVYGVLEISLNCLTMNLERDISPLIDDQ